MKSKRVISVLVSSWLITADTYLLLPYGTSNHAIPTMHSKDIFLCRNLLSERAFELCGEEKVQHVVWTKAWLWNRAVTSHLNSRYATQTGGSHQEKGENKDKLSRESVPFFLLSHRHKLNVCRTHQNKTSSAPHPNNLKITYGCLSHTGAYKVTWAAEQMKAAFSKLAVSVL